MGKTTITLSGRGLKNLSAPNLVISVTATVNVEADQARHAVTGWLLDQVGNMLVGGTPQLVIGKQTVWRVPVLVGSTSAGIVGDVDAIDVDAETGQILIADELPQRILSHAQALASPASTTNR